MGTVGSITSMSTTPSNAPDPTVAPETPPRSIMPPPLPLHQQADIAIQNHPVTNPATPLPPSHPPSSKPNLWPSQHQTTNGDQRTRRVANRTKCSQSSKSTILKTSVYYYAI